MQKKKDNLLGKIVKRNYNNKLEEVLEHKNFSEQTKSLLLSMLYKIETSYSDYEKAKHNVETKDEYMENIISTIRNVCNSIEIVRPNTPQSADLGNRTYIIDERTKAIKGYAIERKILYAIAKIGKKEFIVNQNQYGMFAKPISDLINIGNNINIVEPLRDFNGYSWTTISREIESIEHNLVYQNLRILVGHQALNAWVQNREFVADYMMLLKKRLSNYGEANANKLLELIYKISILLEKKYNPEGRQLLESYKNQTINQMKQVQNVGQFAVQVSEKKKEINEKMKLIDKVLNNENLLQRECIARNNNLPNDRKYPNLQALAQQLIKERENEFDKIEKLNKLLIPQNFMKYKREIENKANYLRLLEANDLQGEIEKTLIKLQKSFLHCFEKKIEQAETKSQIMDVIYEFRYYYLLMFNQDKAIYEVPELQEILEKVITELLDKTKNEGITGIYTQRKELENKIFKEVITLRTIEINNLLMKITKEKETIYLQIFDEESFEKKVPLGTTQSIQKKDLDIRLNKKFKIFY